MKYLLLAYGDEKRLEAMPSSERDAFGDACLINDEALRKSGRLLAVEELQSSQTATTVRVQDGAVSMYDGPYATTNEQLISLFFITARDLNEALQVASKMPQARAGAIEVRPMAEFEQG